MFRLRPHGRVEVREVGKWGGITLIVDLSAGTIIGCSVFALEHPPILRGTLRIHWHGVRVDQSPLMFRGMICFPSWYCDDSGAKTTL